MNTNMIIFHGGCHDCNMQIMHGKRYCIRCMYFDPDWSLPDLNDTHKNIYINIDKIKEEIKYHCAAITSLIEEIKI
jgi:hypothetical protein